jgi:hypothetical protein
MRRVHRCTDHGMKVNQLVPIPLVSLHTLFDRLAPETCVHKNREAPERRRLPEQIQRRLAERMRHARQS